MVAHSNRPDWSRRSTRSCPVAPSTLTSPKCWNPSSGEVLARGGALTNAWRGPNVGSSVFGPKAPAFSGPATNSQNGSKPSNADRSGA